MKLVTGAWNAIPNALEILIHTSVKLVTAPPLDEEVSLEYFNPHEREARDTNALAVGKDAECILIHTSVKLVTRLDAPARSDSEF